MVLLAEYLILGVHHLACILVVHLVEHLFILDGLLNQLVCTFDVLHETASLVKSHVAFGPIPLMLPID